MTVQTLAVVATWDSGRHGDDYLVWSRMFGGTLDAIWKEYQRALRRENAVPAGKPRIYVLSPNELGVGGWVGPVLRMEVLALRG